MIQSPITDTEKTVKEDFLNWKRNTTLLYDFVNTRTEVWPTMTVDWLPELCNSYTGPEGEPVGLSKGEVRQSVVIGTFTGGAEPASVTVADVILPLEEVPMESRVFQNQTDFGGFSYGTEKRKFSVRGKVTVDAEPNRAVHMPQQPQLVVAVGPNGYVTVLDFGSISGAAETPRAVANLKGHTSECWGAAWNSVKTGLLATAADDLKICLWNVEESNNYNNENSEHKHIANYNPIASYSPHTAAPQTVASDKAVNSVSYSVHDEYLIATGGLDNSVALWDDRKLELSLHRMTAHENAISRVAFNPHYGHYLASGGLDRRIVMWDLRLIGSEQRPDDMDDGAPELSFSHGGHTSAINDFAWNSNSKFGMMMCSASDNNQIQFWTVREDLLVNPVEEDATDACGLDKADYELEDEDQ
eukprot:Lankesteria_metandrocarpae@DN5132_c1_g1_i3.p2